MVRTTGLTLLALAAASCGSAATAVGQNGGACRADGTCLAGLTCTQGLCVPLDGGSTQGDGGTGCLAALNPTTDDRVTCGSGGLCDAGTLCCLTGTSAGTCRPVNTGCGAGEKELGCGSSNGRRCASGTVCCMNATSAAITTLQAGTTCPARLDFAEFSLTQCLNACAGSSGAIGKLPVCQANSECQGGATCHPVVLGGFEPITLGVCY